MSPSLRTLTDAAIRRLLCAALVTAVEDPVPGIRIVHLAGDDLRDVSWVPGQKVQLRIHGITTRTYTPTAWDPTAGTTNLVATLHGHGPGAAYIAGLAPGVTCHLFGPRSSLDLSTITGPALLVGDETSIALAVAAHHAHGSVVQHLLEAAEPTRTEALLDHLHIRGSTVLPYRADDALGDHVQRQIADDPAIHLVLTGRAQSIRRVRAVIKEAGVHQGKISIKAYWDERRTGLD